MMTTSNKPLVVFLMGPTASGKTALAVEMVNRLPCDIVSVDSALVYRGMDIGAAKPESAVLQLAPHALIDIRDPAQPYSAADFLRDALLQIEAIVAKNRIPLLVGGTMLYFKVLLEGIAVMPEANEAIREEINKDAEKNGWPYIHQQLQKVDPQSAARINPTDPQRLQRALEVYRISGKTMTDWHKEQKTCSLNDQYKVVNFAIAPATRQQLHERIAGRFQLMLQQGFVEEVEKLYVRKDLHTRLPSIRAVGYRQIWDYLDGKYNYDTMVERGIIATRQLAKRQMTWLRSWAELNWLDSDEEDIILHVLEKIKVDRNF